jgi:structure-specific endonuclease subunit SLX4 (BTB/POZ domain-containing protein 12)
MSCHPEGLSLHIQAPQDHRNKLPSQGILVLGAGKKCYHKISSVVFSSSSCELGAAFESAGEDEGEEEAAIPAADTEEAVRRYVRSKPALYRKVLMYQPLELAELQAELKRDGIRVATAKLLDILDTHCITFTTAAARKEKLERKGQQRVGRKKGERN